MKMGRTVKKGNREKFKEKCNFLRLSAKSSPRFTAAIRCFHSFGPPEAGGKT
jgi:hypothetical protein